METKLFGHTGDAGRCVGRGVGSRPKPLSHVTGEGKRMRRVRRGSVRPATRRTSWRRSPPGRVPGHQGVLVALHLLPAGVRRTNVAAPALLPRRGLHRSKDIVPHLGRERKSRRQALPPNDGAQENNPVTTPPLFRRMNSASSTINALKRVVRGCNPLVCLRRYSGHALERAARP
jgi:hypothetical protein